jgi:ubiquinone/menaquinone biosynthesis C-methylase UbiE
LELETWKRGQDARTLVVIVTRSAMTRSSRTGEDQLEHKEYRKLHAEWYELVSASMGPSKEVECLAAKIRALGQPALELGSGTGKILIPLLEQDHDVIGVDTSEDMTARCLAASVSPDLPRFRGAGAVS